MRSGPHSTVESDLVPKVGGVIMRDTCQTSSPRFLCQGSVRSLYVNPPFLSIVDACIFM